MNFVEAGNAICVEPLRVENGYVYLPEGPGLGIDLDEEALERHAYRHFPHRALRQTRDEGP